MFYKNPHYAHRCYQDETEPLNSHYNLQSVQYRQAKHKLRLFGHVSGTGNGMAKKEKKINVGALLLTSHSLQLTAGRRRSNL